MLRPLRLITHYREEAPVINLPHQIPLSVLKTYEVVNRQIDPPSVCQVLAHVAQDIGELQSVPQRLRVFVRVLMHAAEDPRAYQAHHPRHLPVVAGKFLPALETLDLQIHPAALDDLQHPLRRDSPPVHHFLHLSF